MVKKSENIPPIELEVVISWYDFFLVITLMAVY